MIQDLNTSLLSFEFERLILILFLQAQFFALSDGPISQEHHKDDNTDVDERADDVSDNHKIVVGLACQVYTLDARVNYDTHDLVNKAHRVEDQIKLSKTI